MSSPGPELQQKFLPEYLAAAAAAGIPEDRRPLSLRGAGPPTEGIWLNLLAADSVGRRIDSCTAYLSGAMISNISGFCPKLQLIQSARVTKIVIKRGRAVGVRYLRTDAPKGKQEREIQVVREVVSSAGPYGSPQLLQLSGVGPAAVLKRLRVPQLVDLPVGENTMVRQPVLRPERAWRAMVTLPAFPSLLRMSELLTFGSWSM